MYYILNHTKDRIQANDEWQITSCIPNWYRINCDSPCIRYTPDEWDQYQRCEPGWRVRRKRTTTKLGNEL
jgi:hypothetical protein